MANIQERTSKSGKISYRVQIRVSGKPTQTATFPRKTDAKRWIVENEAAIREGRYFRTHESRKHTLAEMCDRYSDVVLPSKSASMQRGQRQQLEWWKNRIGSYLLADVTPSMIGEQRDYLAKNGSKTTDKPAAKRPTPATVVRYLAALSVAFSHAAKEWGWIEISPMPKVKKPREPRGRVRFLSDEECAKLLDSCRKSENRYLYPVVLLAISTGARSGEIMSLQWNNIDFERARATLFDTKNGDTRALLLSPQLIVEFEKLRASNLAGSTLIFASERKPTVPMELRSYWREALKLAGIVDFRFHDLRHTAASYLAMNGATVMELSEVLGHKSPSMVKRYAHLSETHTRQVVRRMNDKLFPDEHS